MSFLFAVRSGKGPIIAAFPPCLLPVMVGGKEAGEEGVSVLMGAWPRGSGLCPLTHLPPATQKN